MNKCFIKNKLFEFQIDQLQQQKCSIALVDDHKTLPNKL